MTFTDTLLQWFEENKRKLPWREETNPYKIWASEIILQQTRVVQGLDYYYRFLHQFPDVRALAGAQETEVLKIWQGLGYYSRARNMHFAAQTIVKEHNGIFPNQYEQIRKLKGIGDYTAAAIASFAFDLPYPAIDGNVLRFVSRYLGIYDNIALNNTRKLIYQKCLKLIPADHAGPFNQAMMEMGATQCVPIHPNCDICPFQESCYAFQNRQVDVLPFKEKNIRIKDRYFHYLFFVKNNQTILQQRIGKDIWQNLYEFPLVETLTVDFDIQSYLREKKIACNEIPQLAWHTKHILTHQNIYADFYIILPLDFPKLSPQQIVISLDHFDQYPVAKITEEFRKRVSE